MMIFQGNKPPWTLPAKATYLKYDGQRAQEFFENRFEVPPWFPILSLLVCFLFPCICQTGFKLLNDENETASASIDIYQTNNPKISIRSRLPSLFWNPLEAPTGHLQAWAPIHCFAQCIPRSTSPGDSRWSRQSADQGRPRSYDGEGREGARCVWMSVVLGAEWRRQGRTVFWEWSVSFHVAVLGIAVWGFEVEEQDLVLVY